MKKLLIFLVFFIAAAAAAEDRVKLEEVVVTASKVQEAAEETTSSVTVIKGEDIRKMNVEFVPDVLRKVPDLFVRQNGGAGMQITVFLRGGSPSHTLVMIDGVKVNSTTTGSFDFAGISVDSIERIEIVKGPQSTIYGSEAMAGVINIITKKGEGKLSAEVLGEGGSNGTYKASITVSGGEKKYDVRLTGSRFYSTGISSASEGSERDSYSNASFSGKVGIKSAENFDVEITGSHYYDRADLDDFDFYGRMAIDNLGFVQHGHHSLISARARLFLFSVWEQVLTTSLFDEKFRFVDPLVSYNNAVINSSTETVDWQHNFYLSDAYSFTAGLEYRHERGENRDQFDQDIENKAVYLNNKLRLFNDGLIINAGVRHDEHETFGSKSTWKVGAVYAVRDADLRIKASYGTGFRAPKFNELSFPFYGNPDLDPEESSAWEIGAEKDFMGKRGTVSLNYFDQDYKNLIDTDPLSFTAANIAHSSISGLEAIASFKVNDKIRVTAGYTHLETKDKDTGKPLPFRPGEKLTASAEYSSADFSVMADYSFLSSRFDSLVLRELSSYSLVNLSGSYRIAKGVTAFARINNLLDEEYEEVGSFNTPGFSVFGGIKFTYQ